jgi:hypothetical protein
MINNIPIITYDTINDYYKNVHDSKINHIYKKGCGDYLSARIVNNKYFGIMFKKHKLI